MATLRFSAGHVLFGGNSGAGKTLSTALGGLSNGAGTIAALSRLNAVAGAEIASLRNAADNAFYHGLACNSGGGPVDDDGAVFIASSGAAIPAGTTADDFVVVAVTWPAGAANQYEHFHVSPTTGGTGTWDHAQSASANSRGDFAGPGTGGGFWIGGESGNDYLWVGDIAIVAVWVGKVLTDAQIEALFANKKTSDWYTNAAGNPDFLVELTSLTPSDIGANASVFNALGGTSPTLTGLVPTGWTFDGRGSSGTISSKSGVGVI